MKNKFSGALFALLTLLAVTARANAASPAPVETFDGFYVWGAEVDVFIPCNQDIDLWVTTSEKIHKELLEAYNERATAPYEGVFMRLKGVRGPRLLDGFAADYKGSFDVKEIVKVYRNLDNNCSTVNR